MNLLVQTSRLAAFVVALVVILTMTAPFADAGLGKALENVRDTVKCTSGAIFRPLAVVEWGFKHFERLSEKQYGAVADKSMRESLKECMEASESIITRNLGIKKVAENARALAASAKSSLDKVKKLFGKGKDAVKDLRMALAVNDADRRFYEKETGVLGPDPLPAAKPSPLERDIKLFREKRHLGGQPATLEAGAWGDAPVPEGPASAGPRPDVWSEQPEPVCGEGGRECGEEYWNKELQAKAGRLDPWAASREVEGRNREGARSGQDLGIGREANCADPWADCTGTQDAGGHWISDREHVGQGSGESARPDDADSRGDYTSALASLLGEKGSEPDSDYRAALERMEEQVRREKQREAAERARMEQVRREKQREAAERARMEARERAKSSVSHTGSTWSPSSASGYEFRGEQSNSTRRAGNCGAVNVIDGTCGGASESDPPESRSSGYGYGGIR